MSHDEDSKTLEPLHGPPLEPQAWVDAYGDYLFRYANSRLRDPNAAEEVVQETFLAGIRHVDQFAGKGTQRGWLLGILKRKIIDFIRARTRREVGNGSETNDISEQLFDEKGQWKAGVEFGAPPPDQDLTSRELWDVVKGCLTHLPKGQADVFVLSVMEDMESDEICKELDITPQNLWVRLHRARLGLASCVGSKWVVDEKAKSHAK